MKQTAPPGVQRVATASDEPPRTNRPFLTFSALCLTFLLFLIAALTVHHAGFNSPMVYDSQGWINGKVRAFANHQILDVLRICPGRPVLMLTFYLNFLVHGMDPIAFRVCNAAFLAITGLILVWMIFLLLETQDSAARPNGDQNLWISLFLGLLFVVHPLQSLVVLYIWQRGALLGCLFYFAALAAYVSGRSGRFHRTAHAYILTGILFLVGLASKENLGTLPIMLVLAEVIVFRQNLRELVGRVACIGLITVPAALVYSVIVAPLHSAAAVHPPGFFVRLQANYLDSGLTPLQVGLTECRVLFSYIFSILVPFLTGTPLIQAETVSSSLLDPPITLLAFSGFLGLMALSVYFLRRRPLVSFGILLFIVTFSLESLAVAQFLYFGFRAILPMAGLLLIVGHFLPALLGYCRKQLSDRYFTPAVGALALIPVICFSALTWSEARIWNPRGFWERAFRALPPFSGKVEMTPYVSVLTSYGGILVDDRDYGKAIEVLAKALRIGCGNEKAEYKRTPSDAMKRDLPDLTGIRGGPCPGMREEYHTAYNFLGMALSAQGKPLEAIDAYRAATKLKPNDADAYSNWGEATLKLGNVSEAVKLFQTALKAQPDHPAATNNLGEALLRSGKSEEAVRLFRKAIELKPDYGGAFNNLGNAMLASGKVSEAIDLYRRGISFTPNSPELHNNLGAALFRRGDVPQAQEAFRRAVSLRPEFAKARVNLGMVCLKLHEISAALENLNQAITINPRLALAFVYRGQARELSGHVGEAIQDYSKAIEITPDLVPALFGLACAQAKVNDIPSATQHFQRVLQLAPQHYGAHFGLGSLFLANSQFSEAVAHLSKALALRPDSVEARRGLEIAQQGAQQAK